MKSEQLVTDQIVSGGQGSWDRGVPLKSLEDLCGAPVLAA